MASRSSVRKDPIQVFTATGPPLPPIQTSTWHQSESYVRPVGGLDHTVEQKIVYVDEPMKVSSSRPAQGQTIYETVTAERHDPVR